MYVHVYLIHSQSESPYVHVHTTAYENIIYMYKQVVLLCFICTSVQVLHVCSLHVINLIHTIL